MYNVIIKNSAVVDSRKPSYIELNKYVGFLEKELAEKNLEIIKLRKDARRLDTLNLKLYAGQYPDICEEFCGCSVRNVNCIVGDNPQRQACKRFIEQTKLKVV